MNSPTPLEMRPDETESPSGDDGSVAQSDQVFSAGVTRRTALAGGEDRISRLLLFPAAFLCGWTVFKFGGVNFTVSDLFVFLVFSLMLFRSKLNIRPFENLTVYWVSGLTMMLGGLFLSTIINGEMTRWLIVAAQYVFAFVIVPMVFLGLRQDMARQLLALFVLGIVVSQIAGISASLLLDHKDTAPLFGTGFLTGNGRVGSFSGEANRNGAMIAFAFPMLLYCMRDRTIPTGIGLICGLILSWGLLASGSFTAFVASAIAATVYLLFAGFNQFAKFAAAGVIGVFGFVALGAPLPSVFEDRVAGALTSGNMDEAGTFSGRADLVSEAWQMLDTTVLIGLGVDQYREVSIHGAPVHELHLLIWNEGGVLAFVGLLVLLLSLAGIAWSALKKSRPEGALIAAVVIVFMVYSFAITHAYSRAWIMPVFLAMGTFFAVRPNFDAVYRPWKPIR